MNTFSSINTVPTPGAHAVVILSGGQDSVTCLGLALKNYEHVSCIGFRYGQKHEIELAQAKHICDLTEVPFEVFDLPVLSALADSALVTGGDVNAAHARNENLPASFVPNRNAMFLTIGHAYAQKVGAKVLMTGVCQTDYSGYPDCRHNFIAQLESALNIGYETAIEIHTPMMYMTKADTFALAKDVGILETVLTHSHTCYNGDRETAHEWGFGCGECPACKLRAAGWFEFKGRYPADPIPEQTPVEEAPAEAVQEQPAEDPTTKPWEPKAE